MAEASLRKFRPTAANPWDYAKAAHLLNRAGFGGRPEEIERLASLGFDRAVEEFLTYERVPEVPGELEFAGLRQLYGDLVALRQAGADEQTRRALQNRLNRVQRETLQEVREWWMGRMVATQRPLAEKMVLFWHGLLVSGFPDVQNPEFLYTQNQLFRRMPLGNF